MSHSPEVKPPALEAASSAYGAGAFIYIYIYGPYQTTLLQGLLPQTLGILSLRGTGTVRQARDGEVEENSHQRVGAWEEWFAQG